MPIKGYKMRYCSGYSRNQERPNPEDLEFGPYDVKCPACGKMDNHCATRRGLCCNCYCTVLNHLEGTESERDRVFAELPMSALTAIVRRWRPKTSGFKCDSRKTETEKIYSRSEANHKYYLKRKSQHKEYMREYRRTHREMYREYMREYNSTPNNSSDGKDGK